MVEPGQCVFCVLRPASCVLRAVCVSFCACHYLCGCTWVYAGESVSLTLRREFEEEAGTCNTVRERNEMTQMLDARTHARNSHAHMHSLPTNRLRRRVLSPCDCACAGVFVCVGASQCSLRPTVCVCMRAMWMIHAIQT